MNREEILGELNAITADIISSMPSHNYDYTQSVVESVIKACENTGISKNDRFILHVAALTHDIMYVPGAKDNTQKSAEFAASFLASKGFSPKEVNLVKRLILSTQDPLNPGDEMERLICESVIKAKQIHSNI